MECLWHFEGRRGDHARERILPTGTTELVISLRQEKLRVYSDSADLQGQGFARAVVSGPQSRYVVLDTSAPDTVYGVHFRPGGAAPVLGLPLGELGDRHAALEELWGSAASTLRERLLECRSVAEGFALLEMALLSRLRGGPAHHPAVGYALRRFTAEPAAARILDIASDTGYSPRRFISLFHAGVGLTPKRFCRILRLQTTLHRLAHGIPVEWAEVAVESGYCDQAHLIRDFKEMTGVTPGAYRPIAPQARNHVALDPSPS